MKKILLTIAVIGALASCSNSKIDESAASGVTPTTAATDKLEAVAGSDTTKLVCNCEHKCTTKEECVKNCGPECQMK